MFFVLLYLPMNINGNFVGIIQKAEEVVVEDVKEEDEHEDDDEDDDDDDEDDATPGCYSLF